MLPHSTLSIRVRGCRFIQLYKGGGKGGSHIRPDAFLASLFPGQKLERFPFWRRFRHARG